MSFARVATHHPKYYHLVILLSHTFSVVEHSDNSVDFNVVQILPLMEDELESNVINATFMEPFVLLMVDDFKICVLGPDDMGNLDLLEQDQRLTDERWISGSLYDDTDDIFRLQYDDVEDEEAGHVLMFLLTSAGGLHVSQTLIWARKDTAIYLIEY